MNTSIEATAAPARRRTTWLLLWVLARLPGVAVGMAGLAKFYASARWQRLFESWGYPRWFAFAIGAIEVVGAVLLFTPRTTRYGAAVLAVVMLGAFLTLVTHRNGLFGWGSTPLVYFLWLCVVAIAGRGATR